MEFKQFYLGCLAHASYLVGSDGEAAVVDPQRDVDHYIEEAKARGLTIKAIIETHLHADFVSGHNELAARTGAHIYIGHRAGARFEHIPVHDGEELRLGSLTLKFIETPGHTPESISVEVFEAGLPTPTKLLTGDTLFVGDVGRPDLAGSKGYSTEQMAGLMYDTLRDKFAALPDSVEVYPAHGAGSACGRAIGNERWSTLGQQRASNWALQPMSREEFIAKLTDGLASPPPYFAYDAEMNRRGAVELTEIHAPALSPEEVRERQGAGALVLDVRSADAYGRGHVPDSLNIGITGGFAPWAGTLIQMGMPLVLVGDDEAMVREATMRLARIGHETVVGYLAGGMETWRSSSLPVSSLAQMTCEELSARLERGEQLQVLDVRRLAEHNNGHVRLAHHIPLDELDTRFGEVDSRRRAYVICGSGYRSSPACGLLVRHGITDVVNIVGGHAAWEQAGLPLLHPPGSAPRPSARASASPPTR